MRACELVAAAVVAGLCGVAAADVSVLPTTAHAAFNFIPFGAGPGPCVMHQVFASNLFTGPVQITRIAFAPNNGLIGTQQDLGRTTVRLGYTTRTPGQAAGVGLDIPDTGGNGVPNATGAMTLFYDNAAHVETITTGGSTTFSVVLNGTPFAYNPAQGNLLVEIVSDNANTTMSVSRAAGSAEASRAYAGGRFGSAASPTTATRMEFTYTTGTGSCYANCDGSTTPPILNVNDFICFQTKYAAADPTANCDGSTTPPVLNVNDFICFQTAYAAGCP